jgi:hypothetical protein
MSTMVSIRWTMRPTRGKEKNCRAIPAASYLLPRQSSSISFLRFFGSLTISQKSSVYFSAFLREISLPRSDDQTLLR